MLRKRRSLPEVGELVVATVTDVFDKGAYVVLDEYGGKKGYVPLTEVASSWFHNIRDFLKEKQKVVLKVIKVDPVKGYVDLSLKRVSTTEKEQKMLEWKRAQRAEALLSLAAKRLGASIDEAYEKVGWRLEDKYGEIYAGLEETVRQGIGALREAKVDEAWVGTVYEVAKEHIELPSVKVTGRLELRSTHAKGALHIKQSLMKALELARDRGYSARIYVAGTPFYNIEVTAENYRQAELILKEVADVALRELKSLGGTGSLTIKQ
ncbi:MAG: translation initiation factor IF-2 subunit alpha [Candidatus Nezhaarchaeota archaeon]|nr:translation initiation factor IF-2 subunit alpha [Candidatus Nezhaarchaeota archaeon]